MRGAPTITSAPLNEILDPNPEQADDLIDKMDFAGAIWQNLDST